MSERYAIIVQRIDGADIDRETGHPDLEVEMHPIGISLPPEQRKREMHIRIGLGRSKTVLDEDGIAQLLSFVQTNPWEAL